MRQDTQNTQADTDAHTSADKELEECIKRALEGFATDENISRSAAGLFGALGFGVVNEVSELAVSFESLYKRVQNREASKRLEELFEHVEGSYYAGSLTTKGGEDYLATQSETVTQSVSLSQDETLVSQNETPTQQPAQQAGGDGEVVSRLPRLSRGKEAPSNWRSSWGRCGSKGHSCPQGTLGCKGFRR